MTRPTAILTLVVLAGLGGGCSIGMTAKKYRPAQAPKGVIMQVDSTQGKYSGELIEVRESGIVLLTDQKLRLLPYTAILSSSVDQTSSRYAPSNRTAPKPDVHNASPAVEPLSAGSYAGVDGPVAERIRADRVGRRDPLKALLLAMPFLHNRRHMRHTGALPVPARDNTAQMATRFTLKAINDEWMILKPYSPVITAPVP